MVSDIWKQLFAYPKSRKKTKKSIVNNQYLGYADGGNDYKHCLLQSFKYG